MELSLSKLFDILNPNGIEAVEWLRFVLCPDGNPTTITDWKSIYYFCDKQKIGGICEPTRYEVHVDEETLFDWMTLVRKLERSNVLLNKRVCELFQKLQEDGFRCCLLKGQGNAEMYPNPALRFPGDIDVWIDADAKTINDYVLKQFPDAKINYKHIKFPLFDDVPIDVHQTPLKLRNPYYQYRLQQWIEENRDEQFSHKIRLHGTDMEVAIPTPQFNAVYQLGHIMTHIFDEGIGLRQLIDYYYVLKNLEGISKEEKEQIRKVWKRCGMARLAPAIMWLEFEILGLPEELLLTAPDERLGRMIFADTLEAGNFGKYSKRHVNVGKRRLNKRIATFKRLISMAPCFPGETLFRFLVRIKAVTTNDLKRMIH